MAADEYDPNVDPSRRDPATGQPYRDQPYSDQPYGGQQPYQREPYGQDAYRGPGGPGGPGRPEKADEKQNEKEQEKRQEKGAGLDEKYHRNPLGFVTWSLIIIWLGVTLLLQNIDVFEDNDNTWGVFLWGVGALIIAEALIRAAVPRWSRGITGSIIWGAIAIAAGFGLWFGNWEIIGPVVLIAIGVGVLLSRLLPRG
jgi:hypothetical protein